jgi:hypothetical protein
VRTHLYANAFDARGEALELSWPEFCDAVEAECLNPEPVARQRTALPAIGAHALAPGQTRATEAVEAITVGALDVDGATDAALTALLESLEGTSALVHTSPSDGDPAKPGRRFRVYVELSREVPPADSGRLRLGLAALLGVPCDPATLDAARIMFVGRLADTPPREVWRFAGVPLDPAEALAQAPADAPTTAAPSDDLAEPDPGDPAEVEPLLAALAEALTPAWEADGRQEWMLAFLGWMARWWHQSERDDLIFRLAEVRDENTHKYLSMSERARPLTGPNAAVKDALGPAFGAVDALINRHPNALAYRLQFARLGKRTAPAVTHTPPAAGDGGDHPAAAFAGLDDAPPFVKRDGQHWLNRGGVWEGPYTAPDAWTKVAQNPMAYSMGADALDKEGNLRTMQSLSVQYGAVVENLAVDYTVTARVWDPETKTLTEGFSPLVIDPAPDAAVADWMRALAGSEGALQELYEWIASCRQDRLTLPAAALAIVGPTGCGKTFLFTALAQMWGVTEPVPLKSVIQQFNSSLLRCPIWLDDESEAMRDDLVSSSSFRQLTQARARLFEPKGREKRELLGCARIGITANTVDELRFTDVTGDAIDAVSDRIALYVVSDPARVAAALDQIRIPGSNDVDLGRVTGHLSWVQSAVEPRRAGQRFLGSRSAAGRRGAASVVISGTAARFPAVFELLHDFLLAAATPPAEGMAGKFGRGTTGTGFVAHAGSLYAHAQTIANATQLDLRDVHLALRAVSRVDGRRCIQVAGKNVWCRELDPALVASAVPGVPEEKVQAALAAA